MNLDDGLADNFADNNDDKLSDDNCFVNDDPDDTATALTSQNTRRKRKLLVSKCDNASKKVQSQACLNYKSLIFEISNGEQLSDSHINAGNQLLRGQFPDLQGLTSPVLGQKLCFPNFEWALGYAGESYLRVLHNGRDHWVTIEIVSEEEVHIYDSLFKKPNYYIIKQITSILRSRCHQVKLLLEKVQYQRNTVDCGVYAIAFLTDLCHKINPSTCHYAESKILRSHLINCFQEGIMTPFPSSSATKSRPTTMNIKLYCSCRMPYVLEHVKKQDVPSDEDTKMVQCMICDNWYHPTCEGISDDRMKFLANPKEAWMCHYNGCDKYDDLLDSD